MATLTVHPSLTTRANSNDKLVASNTSLHFLYSVLKLVGPVNSGFATAFAFREQSGGSHRKLNRAQQIKLEQEEGYSPIGVVQEEVENIDSEIANEGGLWARGEDFWHVLGWAFNCSVRWPGRWQRWKMWLGFMVELLEDDWEERLGLVVEPGKENVLRESLIMQYLDVAGTAGRTGRRGIMRAIFADGSPKAMGEFKEVFRNETKERKKPDVVNATRKKVNIDEGNFGDYFEDENGDEVEVKVEIKEEDGGRRSSKKFSRGPTTPKRGSAMAVGDTARLPEVSSTEAFENVDALLLRRRILVLVGSVSRRKISTDRSPVYTSRHQSPERLHQPRGATRHFYRVHPPLTVTHFLLLRLPRPIRRFATFPQCDSINSQPNAPPPSPRKHRAALRRTHHHAGEVNNILPASCGKHNKHSR